MTNPIAKFQDGEIWVRQSDGSYKADYLGMWSWSLLMALRARSPEYRTQQDRESIKALETAFKARRAAEEEG